MIDAKQFNPAEFAATLQRVAGGVDHGQSNAQPAFDAAMHAEVVEACLQGRKIEDYKQALESQGFSYYPPALLARWGNGERKTEGEWRNTQMKMAFTDRDVLSCFITPESLWTWCETQRLMRKAALAGLVLPKAHR